MEAAGGEAEGMVHVGRLAEFASTVAVLTQEAADLASALGPRNGARASAAAALARDAVAKLESVVKEGRNPDEALTTAIWTLGLAALAITEAKSQARELLGTVPVHVVAPRA